MTHWCFSMALVQRCAEGFRYQLEHFRGSVAPTLPGHLAGVSCASVRRYTDWVRGWLWAQGYQRDLVLVGFTLGASIALQYGLDYAKVKGLVCMTVAMRPRAALPAPTPCSSRPLRTRPCTRNGSTPCGASCSMWRRHSGSSSSPIMNKSARSPSIMTCWSLISLMCGSGSVP